MNKKALGINKRRNSAKVGTYKKTTNPDEK